MDILDKLDKVFFWLKNRTDLGAYWTKEYIWTFYIEREKESGINHQQFDEIFERLLQDDLIRKRNVEEAKPTYHLTTNGYEFIGYKNEKERKEALEANDKNYKSSYLESSQGTTKWTKWIAYGTVVLVAVAILTLLKQCSG
jgi:hypothetical protein